MIEQILPNIFKIEIPLPNNPLKALNSYFLKDADHCLIIDTGMNRPECKTVMYNALHDLNIDISKTDFFITHLHADHEGLSREIAVENAKIFICEPESKILMNNLNEKQWIIEKDLYLSHGMPEYEALAALKHHPGRIFSSSKVRQFSYIRNNDILQFGEYRFVCLETPGHTPHHMCLYEPDKKLLFSGDHILFDITPNITHWIGFDNALNKYLDSLGKIKALDIKLVLPGHRRIIYDHITRINELELHHDERLKEVITALKDGAKTAYEIAPFIKWDFALNSWSKFPSTQKWFAIGETIAHVEYLEAKGIVRRIMKDDKIIFSLSQYLKQ